MTRMGELLPLLVSSQSHRPACPATGDWLPAWNAAQSAHGGGGPFTAAMAAALRADRVAWAFFSGYQGALQAAFGTAPGSLGTFCVNEAGRKITDIATTLEREGERVVLRGDKSWALTGFDDLTLFVLARHSNAPAKGPGSLAVLRLPVGSAGVECERPRLQEIVPELPHAAIRFESAPVEPSQLVPGDGYADHAKPFRLREDVFVTGCVLAYLLAEAKAGSWPTAWSQRAIAVVSMLEAYARLDPRQPETIIAVAGALSFAGDVIREAEQQWAPHQRDAQDRWLRDRRILALGKEARRQRTIQSWGAVGRAPVDPSSTRTPLERTPGEQNR